MVIKLNQFEMITIAKWCRRVCVCVCILRSWDSATELANYAQKTMRKLYQDNRNHCDSFTNVPKWVLDNIIPMMSTCLVQRKRICFICFCWTTKQEKKWLVNFHSKQIRHGTLRLQSYYLKRLLSEMISQRVVRVNGKLFRY